MKKKVNFEQLASRKTVLFVSTSAVNPSLHCFINIFYGQKLGVPYAEALTRLQPLTPGKLSILEALES